MVCVLCCVVCIGPTKHQTLWQRSFVVVRLVLCCVVCVMLVCWAVCVWCLVCGVWCVCVVCGVWWGLLLRTERYGCITTQMGYVQLCV